MWDAIQYITPYLVQNYCIVLDPLKIKREYLFSLWQRGNPLLIEQLQYA